MPQTPCLFGPADDRNAPAPLGVGVSIIRAGETVARSTDTPRASCGGHKRDLRDPSPALLDGCNGLRTRSLKPRRVAVSNRPTITPLSRAQLLHQVQTRRIRHHPPANSDSRSTG